MDRHSSLVRFIRSEWMKRFEPQLEKIIGRFDLAKPSANFSISPGASPVTSAAASKVQGSRCFLHDAADRGHGHLAAVLEFDLEAALDRRLEAFHDELPVVGALGARSRLGPARLRVPHVEEVVAAALHEVRLAQEAAGVHPHQQREVGLLAHVGEVEVAALPDVAGGGQAKDGVRARANRQPVSAWIAVALYCGSITVSLAPLYLASWRKWASEICVTVGFIIQTTGKSERNHSSLEPPTWAKPR